MIKLSLVACAMLAAGCHPAPEAVAILPVKTVSQNPAAQRQTVFPVTLRQPTPGAPFTTADGETITLQHFSGQVVVLHLWATWCKPCLHEMPLLDHLAAEMQSIKVVPVSVDIRHEQAVTFFQQQFFQRLDAYHDPDGQLMRDLGAHALPISILMDRQGRIAAVLKGSVDWNSESIRTLLSGI